MIFISLVCIKRVSTWQVVRALDHGLKRPSPLSWNKDNESYKISKQFHKNSAGIISPKIQPSTTALTEATPITPITEVQQVNIMEGLETSTSVSEAQIQTSTTQTYSTRVNMIRPTGEY
jgi:hypothetical protein